MPAAVIDNVSGLVNQDQAGGVGLDTTRSVRHLGKVEFVGFLFFSYICSLWTRLYQKGERPSSDFLLDASSA